MWTDFLFFTIDPIHQISVNTRRRKDFLRIPEQDRGLLEEIGWKKKLDAVDAAIQANAVFLSKIVADPAIFEGENDLEEDEGESDLSGKYKYWTRTT